MKKRIALVLCLAMIAGMFAGCDVDINSILAMLPASALSLLSLRTL